MAELFSFIFGRKRAEIGNIVIDASVSESHEANSEITTNPVEEGVDITDHIRNLPLTLSMNGVVTDTPLSLYGVNASIINISGIYNRSSDAYDTFMDMRDKREPFDIITGLRIYRNMAFESLVIRRDNTTGKAIHFNATLKEIVVARTRKTALPLSSDIEYLGGIQIDLGRLVSEVVPATNPIAASNDVITSTTQLVKGAGSIFNFYGDL